jgi:hypothetical protein
VFEKEDIDLTSLFLVDLSAVEGLKAGPRATIAAHLKLYAPPPLAAVPAAAATAPP